MAWRTINNVSSRLQAAHAVSTGSFTLLYSRRQITDLNADTGELELKQAGEVRIAGIAGQGNGTDFYGHASVGTTWAAVSTDVVASIVNQWAWRLVVGNGTSLRFFAAPDNASSAWVEFTGSPLTQTVFDVASEFFGSNGREPFVGDFAAIRLWNVPKTPSALVAERGSPVALDSTGLILDKLGIGDNLSASLAAGTGTLTANGTITLNADLPSSIVMEEEPDTVPVTVGGRLQVDPQITVAASSVGDVVSYTGEYSSISETPTISILLKQGGSTIDTASPTGNGTSYSGSFTSVANGTYTVEASISDSETSGGDSAASDSVVVNEEVVPPDTPTDLTVTNYTSSTVSLSWTDPGESDSFQIEIAYGWPNILWAYPETTTYTWSNLSPATAYGFRVRAQKDGLWSPWSDIVEQTTLPAAPAAPSIAATTLSDTSIRIDWQAVPTATEYRVYRKASPGGQRTLIYTGSALTHTDTGLAEGSLYYYDVSASNVSGTTFSAETNATTLQSDGPAKLIIRAPEKADIGRMIEVVVQVVTGRGDPILSESVTITASLAVDGDLTEESDAQGYATFLLTPTEAGSLVLSAAGADTTGQATVAVAPEEDAAMIAARLVAAEKKSTRQTPKPSPPPLESSAPPLALSPEPVSPLAALLNEMLLAPQMPVAPISLSEFMPAPPVAPPPSNGTQRAIEALDQAIAAQMQALHQQLQTLNKLIE